jgi:5-oxoprolinase (ATP-hydrolysing) subunit A
MNGSSNDSLHGVQSIDLNADLGEGFPNDRAVLELVTSASICCNEHAGSVDAIRRTLALAAGRGVVVGAHPGYRDRDGFGRREQALSETEVRQLILDQLGFIHSLADQAGLAVQFVKPHGALYNQAQRDPEIAQGVVAALDGEFRLPLIGQPGTLLERMAGSHSVRYISEGFPDRRYRDDGSLWPRSEPGAVLHDPAAMEAQVLRLVNDRRVLTLCIHGDDPRAVANAELVRGVLSGRGIAIRGFLDEPARCPSS